MKYTSTSSTAFSNLLNVGIKYNLDDRLRLLAHIDYWSFKPEFTRTATIQSSTPTTSETKTSPSLNTLNSNIGLGYSF
jgi:outer membrane protein W